MDSVNKQKQQNTQGRNYSQKNACSHVNEEKGKSLSMGREQEWCWADGDVTTSILNLP